MKHVSMHHVLYGFLGLALAPLRNQRAGPWASRRCPGPAAQPTTSRVPRPRSIAKWQTGDEPAGALPRRSAGMALTRTPPRSVLATQPVFAQCSDEPASGPGLAGHPRLHDIREDRCFVMRRLSGRNRSRAACFTRVPRRRARSGPGAGAAAATAPADLRVPRAVPSGVAARGTIGSSSVPRFGRPVTPVRARPARPVRTRSLDFAGPSRAIAPGFLASLREPCNRHRSCPVRSAPGPDRDDSGTAGRAGPTDRAGARQEIYRAPKRRPRGSNFLSSARRFSDISPAGP